MTQKITVIMSEKSSPAPPVSPWPLIYTLEVINPQDEDAVRRQIADERYDEIYGDGGETQDEKLLAKILDGIEVHFAFAGDIGVIADWRM